MDRETGEIDWLTACGVLAFITYMAVMVAMGYARATEARDTLEACMPARENGTCQAQEEN